MVPSTFPGSRGHSSIPALLQFRRQVHIWTFLFWRRTKEAKSGLMHLKSQRLPRNKRLNRFYSPSQRWDDPHLHRACRPHKWEQGVQDGWGRGSEGELDPEALITKQGRCAPSCRDQDKGPGRGPEWTFMSSYLQDPSKLVGAYEKAEIMNRLRTLWIDGYYLELSQGLKWKKN